MKAMFLPPDVLKLVDDFLCYLPFKVACSSLWHLLHSRHVFVTAYLAGHHEMVWKRMRLLGDFRTLPNPVRRDVDEVVALTMSRVRRNCCRITDELAAMGFPATAEQVVEAPDLTALEEWRSRIGPVPLALESFWKVVGAVDFALLSDYGHKPFWRRVLQTSRMADPLVVHGFQEDLIKNEWDFIFDVYRDYFDVVPPDVEMDYAFAPDNFHKHNVSGGEPYRVQLNCALVDPMVTVNDEKMPFTEYLRDAVLTSGGHPGLVSHPQGSEVIKRLTSNLEQF